MGDIIVHQGRGPDAKFIYGTDPANEDSHVSMVVRDPTRPDKVMLTEEYPSVVGEELREGLPKFHTGAQLVDLRERLETYPSGKMGYRPLYVLESHNVNFRTGEKREVRRLNFEEELRLYHLFVQKIGNAMPEYNLNLLDFAQYGTRTDPADDDNGGKYVCTSWFTHVALEIGIFAKRIQLPSGEVKDLIPGNVLLSDFNGLGSLPTVSGLWYGTQRHFMGAQREVEYPAPENKSGSNYEVRTFAPMQRPTGTPVATPSSLGSRVVLG